ncbi:MAG: ATP-binding cassette domain-containing protein [Pseudomonadota bacterium]|nr:ATP-binding cassette domain-containing protein [Pseudomonadota bacterium]
MNRHAGLELDAVHRAFDARKAVDGLSLRLAPGEVYALLGPNGAGKTTTLNMSLGFLRPDHGGIRVASKRWPIRSPHARASPTCPRR